MHSIFVCNKKVGNNASGENRDEVFPMRRSRLNNGRKKASNPRQKRDALPDIRPVMSPRVSSARVDIFISYSTFYESNYISRRIYPLLFTALFRNDFI